MPAVFPRLAAVGFVLTLVACDQVQEATDNVARTGARAAVDEVLVTRFPNVDGSSVTPYTDCIINQASGREIGRLAQAALVGVDENTIQLVLDIAQRPDAVTCFAQAALSA